jgi:hypothetical protein
LDLNTIKFFQWSCFMVFREIFEFIESFDFKPEFFKNNCRYFLLCGSIRFLQLVFWQYFFYWQSRNIVPQRTTNYSRCFRVRVWYTIVICICVFYARIPFLTILFQKPMKSQIELTVSFGSFSVVILIVLFFRFFIQYQFSTVGCLKCVVSKSQLVVTVAK